MNDWIYGEGLSEQPANKCGCICYSAQKDWRVIGCVLMAHRVMACVVLFLCNYEIFCVCVIMCVYLVYWGAQIFTVVVR